MIASNLERNPTHKGRWIAYDAEGFAFRITGETGNWMARPSYLAAEGDYRLFTARTLGEIADKVGASRRALSSA